MRRPRRGWQLAGLTGLVLAAGVSVAADLVQPLRFDPFARPELGSGAEGGEGRAPRARAEGWAPVLRATLAAGEDSLANLGGVILRRGEQTHGYRLLEVRPFEAVFLREGERVVLPLASQEGGP